jgi:outer membrane lipoprotein SlyB
MNTRLRTTLALATVFVAGCATFPTGPSVMALPGTRMNFDQFRFDDYECRNYAAQSIGGTTAQQTAVDSNVKSAAVATAIGAVAGAAIGGNSRGAAVGAGTGLLFGSAAGAGAGDASGRTMQQRYDIAYTQCMYAKGHKVPVSGSFTSAPRAPAEPTYSPPPPPPPGSPPPPPASYPPVPR